MTDIARTNPYNTWIDETGAHLTPATVDATQRLRDWVDLFRDVIKAAEFLSKTPFVPREMLNKPADVAAAIMKGHELGMDPLDALANIYVINGRVGFYAEFMRRRIIQSGHQFRVIEMSDHRAVVEGVRKDTDTPQRASFTAEQARNANLKLGNYPADKLLARATSRLCRQVFPDVLSGSLIAEDLIDGLIPANEELPGAAEQHGVAAAPVQRKRTPRKARAAATQPPPVPVPGRVAAAGPNDDDLLLDDDEWIAAAAQAAPPPERAPTAEPGVGLTPDKTGERTGGTDMPAPTPPIIDSDTADLHAAEAPLPFDEPEPPATKKQRGMMFALFADIRVTSHNDRVTVASSILGYPVTTTGDFTGPETSTVIDTIQQWQARHTADEIAAHVNDILNLAAIRQAAESGDPQ